MPAKISLNNFLVRAKNIYGDKYDYSKSIFLGTSKKIEIICPKHGSFWQLPIDHLTHECGSCGVEKRSKSHIFNFEKFLEKAKEKHKDKYFYYEETYSSAKSKIKINCKKHGDFWQQAYNHYSGQGCPKCNTGKPPFKTLEQFLNQANKVHGNKYDYSKVNFKTYSFKVEIICPDHGSFWQTPTNHATSEYGCIKCSKAVSKQETAWLNSLKIDPDKRNIRLPKLGKIIVDGWDGNKKVYEYNGSFWHGDPRVYKREDVNWVNKKTFGELYDATMKKAAKILAAGYELVTMWEEDYKILAASVASSDLSPLVKVT
jgi:hypothetical protein